VTEIPSCREVIRESFRESGERAATELTGILERIAVAHRFDRHASEEARQEALAELWRKRATVVDPEAFTVSVFLRRMTDWSRSAQRREIAELEIESACARTQLGEAERCAWLNEGFCRLDRRSSDLIWAKHLGGRSDAEIAARHGLSPKSVPKLISRAEQKFRSELLRG
jgi:RNA polymerase sigma factor (sigma-70 family)